MKNRKIDVRRVADKIRNGQKIDISQFSAEVQEAIKSLLSTTPIPTGLPSEKATAEIDKYFSAEKAELWAVLVKNGNELLLFVNTVEYWKNQLLTVPNVAQDDKSSKENGSVFQVRMNFKQWYRTNAQTIKPDAVYPMELLKALEIGDIMKHVVNNCIYREKQKRRKQHKKLNRHVAYNIGFQAEMLVADYFGTEWELNLAPHTEKGDICVDGVEIQIKSHINNRPVLKA